MTGRHEGPPAGSAAREATASRQLARNFAAYALADGGDYASIRRRIEALTLEHDALGTPIERIVRPPLCPPEPDDDPPRCWSCGHRFGDGCECSCCNDDHDDAPEGFGPDAV